MDQLLAVKIGCLAGVLLITLFCGLIPAQIKWFHINMARGKHRRILSFIGCFAAGVFLGACIMHMVADALGDIETEIRKRQHMESARHKENSTYMDTDNDSERFLVLCAPQSLREMRNFLYALRDWPSPAAAHGLHCNGLQEEEGMPSPPL